MENHCVYCGTENPATRDHVPPRCIFPKPPPNDDDLITVPSCKKCQGSSKDDEYFMCGALFAADGMIANGFLEVSDQDREIIERKKEEVYTRLARPGLNGLAFRILEEMQEVPVVTRGNLLIPNRTHLVSFPEVDRVDRVAERIIRGLFYYEKGYRVPETHSVQAKVSQIGIDRERVDFFRGLYDDSPLANMRIIQEGVFAYGYWECSDDKDATIWLGDFYNVPLLTGIIRPHQ